ncbi:MAG: metal ABC transporter ATP-binding protein, partial [Halothermotrichaceae bacterium]
MKNIIKVNNLSYSYDKEPVLKNVNLEINRGDFAAFIGSNGSGKSTFLKILLGLIKADKGEVKLFGEKVSQFDEWKKTGYISQQVKDFNKSFPATVKEIIAANLYHEMGFLKILKGKHDKKINKALKLVDMIKYKNRLIGNLSGGQQQRVFIARTLVTDPDIIFLDEPLVGVDAVVQDDFFDLI